VPGRDRAVGEVAEVAGEVAGVGGRVRALALDHRKAGLEGVGREGRVDVQVPEQDLLGLGHPSLARRCALGVRAPGQDARRDRRLRHLSRILVLSVETEDQPGGPADDEQQGHEQDRDELPHHLHPPWKCREPSYQPAPAERGSVRALGGARRARDLAPLEVGLPLVYIENFS
jgi:hypothetical protein